MISAITAAKYLAAKYNEKFHQTIDQMKLLKLLYFAQREALVRSDNLLFTEPIYAYQFGPVVKEVRQAFSSISERIQDIPLVRSKDDLSILDYILEIYGTKNSWSLSRLTHAESSWIKARRSNVSGGGERIISVEDIRIDAKRIRNRRALRSCLA